MTPLTQKVIRYQNTGQGLERLTEEITRLVYRFPCGRIGFSDEDAAEFLLQFSPRINGLVCRYRETGQSFESYLGSAMRWQLKSFAAKRSAERIRHVALCGPGGDLHSEMEHRLKARKDPRAAEVREAPVTPSPRSRCCSVLTTGQCQRLVHMSLKMSERLEECDYRRVAAAAGCDPAWLLDCWHRVRSGCDAKRLRRDVFRARRDSAWFKVRCLQYRLQLVLEEEERVVAQKKLAMWRRRYECARRVLERMHLGPTHADIARVLGVPKGTVDSSVFYGKRELRDPVYRSTLARAVPNT